MGLLHLEMFVDNNKTKTAISTSFGSPCARLSSGSESLPDLKINDESPFKPDVSSSHITNDGTEPKRMDWVETNLANFEGTWHAD
jgi:hypothetical protein